MLARATNNTIDKRGHFNDQMQAYGQWKATITHTIEEYRQWLQKHRIDTAEFDLRLNDVLDTLRNDRLVVAFVAEFSRGKTELINAIFFPNYQRRLLPSDAGRTTMCPTELFYDQQSDKPYLRLLPIETRLEDISIAEFKKTPDRWVNMPLDTDSPDQMAEVLREVVKVKRVNVEAAKQLGLHIDAVQAHLQKGITSVSVDIPMWRHALISFPHPLLKQGLSILDTPGLNALGSEPELTLSMLPNAHAVLFVLAADTGVTRTDMDIWQHHIKSYRKNDHNGLVVALNKIDTLWDEMKTNNEVENSIHNQCRDSAKLLGIAFNSVFPVSAQKALLAKVRKDLDLLERSHILELESYLADKILPEKQAIVRDSIIGTVDQLLLSSRQMIAQRLENIHKQWEDLHSLNGRNTNVVVNLMQKTRERQTIYHKNMESFQASRHMLAQHSKTILEALSIPTVDNLIGNTRKEMEGSWTTIGLKKGMKTFFEGARDIMQYVSQQVEQAYGAIDVIYRNFYEEHGLSEFHPNSFSISKYRLELEKLYEEAEIFRNSPMTTMTEQHFVIKKFFISLASHVRYLFIQTKKETDIWLKGALLPLARHIGENKQALDQYIENLSKINKSRDFLDNKLNELEKRRALLERETDFLIRIQERLHAPLPSGDTELTGSETLRLTASGKI